MLDILGGILQAIATVIFLGFYVLLLNCAVAVCIAILLGCTRLITGGGK